MLTFFFAYVVFFPGLLQVVSQMLEQKNIYQPSERYFLYHKNSLYITLDAEIYYDLLDNQIS